jgi:hypothetical protein
MQRSMQVKDSFILHSQDLGPVKSNLYYKNIKENQNLST